MNMHIQTSLQMQRHPNTINKHCHTYTGSSKDQKSANTNQSTNAATAQNIEEQKQSRRNLLQYKHNNDSMSTKSVVTKQTHTHTNK